MIVIAESYIVDSKWYSSLSSKIKRIHYRNRIKHLIDTSPYERYNEIKNNPDLTFQELQRIIDSFAISYENEGDNRLFHEIITHKNDLEKKYYIQRYNEIKNNPNLTFQELEGIISWLKLSEDIELEDIADWISQSPYHSNLFNEVVTHKNKLRTEHYSKKYNGIKDNTDLTVEELEDIISLLPPISENSNLLNQIIIHKNKIKIEYYRKIYNEIKGNPDLTIGKLQQILTWLPAPSEFKGESKEKEELRNLWNTIVNHKNGISINTNLPWKLLFNWTYI